MTEMPELIAAAAAPERLAIAAGQQAKADRIASEPSRAVMEPRPRSSA